MKSMWGTIIIVYVGNVLQILQQISPQQCIFFSSNLLKKKKVRKCLITELSLIKLYTTRTSGLILSSITNEQMMA